RTRPGQTGAGQLHRNEDGVGGTVTEAYICAALRTPVGKHGGALASVRADDLAAIPIKAVVERTGIEPASIDDVILGCTNQAGEIADTTVGWRFPNPRLKQQWTIALGETAELVAERYKIGRAEQDAFAVESQRRAERALKECVFTDELVPVPLPDGTSFAKDE